LTYCQALVRNPFNEAILLLFFLFFRKIFILLYLSGVLVKNTLSGKDQLLCGLMWETGGRISDILNLKWADINFNNLLSAHLKTALIVFKLNQFPCRGTK
jgi:integrase